MATIDSRIALGFQPQTQLESAPNALAKMLQLQGAQQESQMRGMQMQDAADARVSKNKLAELYRTSIGADGKVDRNRLLQGAAQQGLGAQIPGLQKEFADADEQQGKIGKTAAETEKLQIATARDQLTLLGQLAGGIRDQASYDQAKALAQSKGVDVSAFPPQYDPATVQAFQQQALTAEEQLAQVWKQKGYDLDTQKFGETVRSNKAGEGLQRRGQDITVRGQNLTDARGRDANALKAREVEAMGGAPSGAPVLGVPAPAVLPWANQTNPRDANKVKASEQTRGAKEIEKDIDAAKKERDAAANAKRFIELNNKTNTGGLVDRMGITRGLQSLGPEYAEMESITAKLAPAMRVEGSGSTSDFDGKQFERATVGVDKPKATNTNIAKAVVARAQQSEEYADFRQTYLEQNGTLQGADRYWKDYANKNPIFDPEKPGTFELNTARKPWKDHFKAAAPAKPKPGAGGGVVDFGDLK